MGSCDPSEYLRHTIRSSPGTFWGPPAEAPPAGGSSPGPSKFPDFQAERPEIPKIERPGPGKKPPASGAPGGGPQKVPGGEKYCVAEVFGSHCRSDAVTSPAKGVFQVPPRKKTRHALPPLRSRPMQKDHRHTLSQPVLPHLKPPTTHHLPTGTPPASSHPRPATYGGGPYNYSYMLWQHLATLFRVRRSSRRVRNHPEQEGVC